MPITPATLVLVALALWVLTLVACLAFNERFRHDYADWLRWKDPFGLKFTTSHPVFSLYTLATFGGACWVLYA